MARWRKCHRCGQKAEFTALFSEPDPKRRGGKEKSEPNVPLVWECGHCSFIFPLVLTAQGAA